MCGVFVFVMAIAYCGSVVTSMEIETGSRRPFLKCCEDGHLLGRDLNCRPAIDVNATVFSSANISHESTETHTTCFKNGDGGFITVPVEMESQFNESTCWDILSNGTVVALKIVLSNSSETNASCQAYIPNHCRSIFTPLKYWGATIVIFANVIYIIPYVVVVLAYIMVPNLRNRAYDRAVVCYNVAQIIQNGLMIGIGQSLLCYKKLSNAEHIVVGLVLMYLTLASTIWLLVICFDITLVITRFRWAHTNEKNQHQETKKFLIYCAVAWGASAVPTLLAMIMELAPIFPVNSVFRPNFHNFYDANFSVIIYVTSIPILVCITNSILFVYTSYKMYETRKATAMATGNLSKKKKSYIVFLKLYLLMDTAWVSGALGAAFPHMWIIKFFRMIQPILMLVTMVPRKVFVNALKRKSMSSNMTTQTEKSLRRKSVKTVQGQITA